MREYCDHRECDQKIVHIGSNIYTLITLTLCRHTVLSDVMYNLNSFVDSLIGLPSYNITHCEYKRDDRDTISYTEVIHRYTYINKRQFNVKYTLELK